MDIFNFSFKLDPFKKSNFSKIVILYFSFLKSHFAISKIKENSISNISRSNV